MAQRLSEILGPYAGFGPGIVISLVVSLATGGAVGRRLGTSTLVGTGLVMSVGLILSATITPSLDALTAGAQGSGTCDLGRIGPPSWWELRHLTESSLNVILFLPLGVTIGLCPPTAAKRIVIAGAIALPFIIELVQLVAIDLGRQCQSSDVVDNMTGLLAGLIVASLARHLWARRSAKVPGTG